MSYIFLKEGIQNKQSKTKKTRQEPRAHGGFSSSLPGPQLCQLWSFASELGVISTAVAGGESLTGMGDRWVVCPAPAPASLLPRVPRPLR